MKRQVGSKEEGRVRQVMVNSLNFIPQNRGKEGL